jgi:hypothetical protein
MAILNSSELLFRPFEPILQHRFIMYMENIPAFMIKTASAPSFTDDIVKLDHINSYRKIRGKREWGDMDITLYKPITPSGAQAVMEWARLGYESVTGRAGYSDFYKKQIVLNELGPVGDIVGEWIIEGAFLQSANFGTYDWSSSEIVDISCTLSMDYAILNF